VLYAGTSSEEKYHFHSIDVTSDGKYLLTDDGDSIFVWDYEKGEVKQTFHNGETIAWDGLGGVYPDNNRVVYFSYNTEQQIRKLNIYEISTNAIVKSISTYPKSADQVNLSKDGRYLAIGFRYRPVSDMIYTMELWNAETLTTIKSFGSPGDIHEFRDVQISDDNQYVGFRGDNLLFLYTITGKELKIPLQKYVYSFAFTPNCKFITLDIETIDNQENVYIYELSSLNKSYMYTNIFPRIMRYNTNNDFFISKMRLYSNHWYEVGITNPLEKKIQIKNTSYTNNSLQITTEGIEIIKILMITDTLGKKIYIKNEIPVLNNKTEIPLSLPSGNYLLKIVSNGKEYTSKFVVVR
jgi:WD40 repeat protein